MLLLLLNLVICLSVTLAYRSPVFYSIARAHTLNRHQYLMMSESPISEAAMSIDEIKAELDMRKVNYEDCLSKNELVTRLMESRVTGKADPEILKNLQDDPIDLNEVDDAVFDDVTAKDGSLPGGMSKEMLRALSSDPEIMKMLRDPKMQDIMQAVMSGGPDAIKKYMSDPDALLLLQKLSGVMGKFSGQL